MGRLRAALDRGADLLRARLEQRLEQRYTDAPLCRVPMAPPAEYRRIWIEAQRQSYPVVNQYEERCQAAIDPIWFHELALLTQVPIKASEICYQHGRLLYSTLAQYVRARSRDHLTIVESGTARGFSGLCMAKALADSGASGKIVSFDVLPHEVPILWNCVRDADGPRTRAELLHDYADLLERYLVFHRGDTRMELAKMAFPRIHFAFLDSVHTYDHVMTEFGSIRGRQASGDILFFDDYTPEAYPGVVRAADEICREHGYAGTVVTASPGRRYLIAEKQ